MSYLVPPALVEPVVQGLLGAIDVDGGPTSEQLAVLRAITTHLWERPDLDPALVEGADAAATAGAVGDPAARRRFHEMLFTLEACRHPLTVTQVERVEAYATALGADGPDLELFRTFVVDGRTRASADFDRFLARSIASRHEPGLAEVPPDAPEPELAARVRAFGDLPADSLGRAYLAFYERHHLTFPGEEATSFNHFFVSHDMTHVIAGIEPTAAGEIALSAMQLGMDDNPINVGALLASLVVHEAGIGASPTFGSEAFVLADPVAADLLGRSLARGAACTGDFSLADHFALAPRPIADVRAQFGVPAPGNPDDGHHHW
jgi:hypothetical protein